MTDEDQATTGAAPHVSATKEALFREKFVGLLAELTSPSGEFADALVIVGALARRIMADAGVSGWTRFKESQSAASYDAALRTFQKHGNTLVAERKLRTAYAVQVLAMSMIARTQSDPAVQAGDRQLDQIIDFAATQTRPPNATSN